MFRLEAFGGLAVVDGAGAEVATQPRRLALLALLAVAGSRGLTRAKIQAYLWSESAADSARHGLEQLLYYLRRQSAADVFLGPDPLRLNPSVISSDVAAFEQALARGVPAEAAALYRGPFLDGFFLSDAPEFERWVEDERSRLAASYREVLHDLAQQEGECGCHTAAVGYWRRLVAVDPLSTGAVLGLMQAMVAAGDRAGAVRLAHDHEARIREEFGNSLSPEVSAYAARLCSAAAASPETKQVPLETASSVLESPALEGGSWSTDGGINEPVLTPPSRPEDGQPHAARRLLAIGVTLGVLATVGVIATLGLRFRSAPALDPNLVAVAPFEVLDPKLELWREGLVDVLSADLDGAEPLRAVPPTLVVRRWRGRVDRASAADLGRRTGARLVVFGRLATLGGDSVRLSAALLDAARGNIVGDLEFQAPESQLDRLTDSLTVALLRELGSTRLIGAVRRASLGAVPLPALKAYLRGEQFDRRWASDSALASFQQAVALDSTFAMATARAGDLSWSRSDSLGRAFYLRAGTLNHGLTHRDSLLLAADSLYASVAGEVPAADSGAPARRRRLLAILETAAKWYSDDPGVWYELGDARYDLRWDSADSLSQTLEAFDQAIALDSSFGPPYGRALFVAGFLHDWPGVRRRAVALLEQSRPTGELGQWSEDVAQGAELIDRLLDPLGTDSPTADNLLRTVSPRSLAMAWDALQGMTDSAEAAVRLGRALYSRRAYEVSSKTPAQRGPYIGSDRLLASTLGYRGHLLEAAGVLGQEPARVLGPRDFPRLVSLFAELSLAGAVPSDTARMVFHRWLHQVPFWPAGGLVFALPWWSANGDTASLNEFRRRAVKAYASVAASASRQPNLDDPRYGAAAAEAYLELARHDTATALRRFGTIPLTSCSWCFLDRLTDARILAAQHRDREALAMLNPGFPLVWALPTQPVWALERARIAERANDRQTATDSYRFVTEAWRHADPVLQPYVAEAQAALERLSRHPRS
jgi:serine/threonine-protein kinase